MADGYRTGIEEMQALVMADLRHEVQKKGWEDRRQADIRAGRPTGLVGKVESMSLTLETETGPPMSLMEYCPKCQEVSTYGFKWLVGGAGSNVALYGCTNSGCTNTMKK